MARDYTAVPHEYLDEMDELSDEEFGRLIRILLKYSQTGELSPPDGNERFYVKRVLNTEDRYQKSFDERDAARSEKAQKAANARWADAQASPSMPKHAQACTSIPSNACDANIETKTKPKTKTKPDIPPQSPPGGDAFDRFWQVYPKKVGKQAAWKTWSKLKPDAELTETILTAVEYQRNSDAWTKENGRFIPNPATWLNQGRWEDEMTVLPQAKAPAEFDYGDIDRLYEEMVGNG